MESSASTGPSQPWRHVWSLLLAGDGPQPAPPPSLQTIDTEFDFLAESPAPAAPPVVVAGPPDPQRVTLLAAFPPGEAAGEVGRWLIDDPRLDRLDAAAALWVVHSLADVSHLEVPEHGSLLRLLQRAARSPDPQLAVAAARAVGRTKARAAQLDVVARLHADPSSLGHAGIDEVLAALQVVADGRCVREMEVLLLERGQFLSDSHAWQARHIVQVIRRGGRK